MQDQLPGLPQVVSLGTHVVDKALAPEPMLLMEVMPAGDQPGGWGWGGTSSLWGRGLQGHGGVARVWVWVCPRAFVGQ